MRLQDLIVNYVDFRRAMGHKFISGNERLQAFCRAVGSDIDARDVDAERVLSFLGRTTTRYWHRHVWKRRCGAPNDHRSLSLTAPVKVDASHTHDATHAGHNVESIDRADANGRKRLSKEKQGSMDYKEPSR